MTKLVVALLLLPSLALGDAPRAVPLAPRVQALSTPELLEQHEELETGRPGLVAPLVIAGAGVGTLLLGLIVAARTSDSDPGLNLGEGLALSMMVAGAVVALVGAVLTVVNAVRRATYTEQLVTVRAELDVREKSEGALTQPELLALLAAPMEAAPTTGSLLVLVTDARGPVAGATVTAAGQRYTSDARGAVAIDGLPPGPVALGLAAEGHVPAEEAAAVVAGVRTPVTFTLAADREKAPARLTGVVRSRGTGKPIAAQLEIAEAKAKVAVDAEGMFRLDVPGGSYTVVISAPGYLEQKKQVKVASGDRAIFNVELHPR